MKIKSDYVTNSSSTCYILTLPENYNPDRKEVVLAIEESYVWSPPSIPKKQICGQVMNNLTDEIYRNIEEIKIGHTINKFINRNGFDSEESINIHKFEILLILLREFILTELEMASEHGQDRIISISSKAIENAFFRNNSEKITKTLKKVVQED